jgi:uncharacterized iron-regulated membrane protein
MRKLFTLVHRYAGLLIAGFLFVSGFTGAIISWDHELDDLLNPHLMKTTVQGDRKDPFILAAQIERDHPHAQVTYIPLAPEAGESMSFSVQPRIDPQTAKPFKLGFNEVFIDPVSGAELGTRDWGAAWPITPQNFVSFLYVLHYSLHLPESWGLWLMGGIAMVWMFDCFVGFYLTLPRKLAAGAAVRGGWWSRWAPAWKIKTSGSAYRANFDIHRAFGLWFWALLFMLAFTAFSLNLYREVFYPIMSTVSKVTPTPFDTRTPVDEDHPIAARLSFPEAFDIAKAEAAHRGFTAPPGDIFYSPDFGIYTTRFFQPGGDHGAAGVGPPELYVDGADGQILGDRLPWKGTVADVFVQAQFPLHSGRILGLPGRILISIMGAVTAALSVTGVVIWLKKRGARLHRQDKSASAGPAPSVQAAE